MLRGFIANARYAGVPMGTVMFPNPTVLAGSYAFDYLHDRVHEVCVEERIHCVDLRRPFLSSFTQVNDIVVSPFDGHPSAKASLVAADAIRVEFKDQWRRQE